MPKLSENRIDTRIVIVLITTLIGVVMGIAITFLMPKEYRSSVTIVLYETEFPVPNATEAEVFDPVILDRIITKLGLQEEWREKDLRVTRARLHKGLSIRQGSNKADQGQFIDSLGLREIWEKITPRVYGGPESTKAKGLLTINMLDADANLAAEIANKIGEEYLRKRFDQKWAAREAYLQTLNDTQKKEYSQRLSPITDRPYFWERAEPAQNPASPSPILNIALGAILGLGLGLGAILGLSLGAIVSLLVKTVKNKHIAIVIIAMLIGMATGAAISLSIPKKYSSTAIMEIPGNKLPISDATKSEILDPVTLDRIISKLKLQKKWSEQNHEATRSRLLKGLNIKRTEENNLLAINMLDADANLAAEIANEIGVEYQVKRRNEEDAVERALYGGVLIKDRPILWEFAEPARHPISPSLVLNITLGGLLGLAVGSVATKLVK